MKTLKFKSFIKAFISTTFTATITNGSEYQNPGS